MTVQEKQRLIRPTNPPKSRADKAEGNRPVPDKAVGENGQATNALDNIGHGRVDPKAPDLGDADENTLA